MISVIVQGHKRSVIGKQQYQYGQYQYMVTSIDMPSTTHIPVESTNQPFLAMSVEFDRHLMSQLLTELPEYDLKDTTKPAQVPSSMILDQVDAELLDAFLRLLALQDHPERIAILAPMIIREIHFLLLTGSNGYHLRLLCALNTQSNRIVKAINWLQINYKESFEIDQLAQYVNMAPSSFYRHFRQMTNLSPLQFQKRLRLSQAERLMVQSDYDSLNAALSVGYESVSQFNREYKRQFGDPPLRDINKKKRAGILTSGAL